VAASHHPPQKPPDGPPQSGPAARPLCPWPPAAVLVAFSAAGLLAYALRNATLPEGAARLAIFGLGLVLAGCLLAQAVALSRARVRLRAFEAGRAEDGAGRASGPDAVRLESVLRAASRTSFIATDTNGIIRVFNSGAEHMLGYAADEMVGLKTPAAVHLDAEVEAYGHLLSERLGRPVRGFEAFVALVREGGAGAFDVQEWTCVRKDGGRLPVRLTITGIYSSAGELEGFLGVGADISEQKELEATLRQAQLSVDRAEDMILWVDLADHRLCYVNEAACRNLGYARNELLGMNAQALNPLRGKDHWAELDRSLRQGGVRTFEILYCRKDGSLFPVETKAALVEHEGVEYAVGIARDVSERKQAEERLQGEALLNRSLAQVARALIGTEPDLPAIATALLDSARELTGSDHGYVSVIDQHSGNLVPHTMTGMMPGGACGMAQRPPSFAPNPDGTYPGLWGHGLNLLQGFFDNAPAAHHSARGTPAGHVPLRQFLAVPAVVKGRLVGQIALANPGRDYDGADLAAVQALADLFALGAEQILSRKALLEAKEAAEASSRAKGEFLANMTHEVRTPLNGVLGMLQVLQATGLNQGQRDAVAVALESAERLHLLLTNVLEFARLDSALAAPPECLSFPPTDLLRALAAVTEPKARTRGLAFSTHAEPGLPQSMRSDPAALRQCLEHLLDNAVKFTPAGAVRLCAGPVQGPGGQPRLAFRVEDTGIGIAAGAGQAVFEAFAQADAGITRMYGGAGLGLAIAHRLARRLGGDIEAQARPGGGTVMILTVPANCCPTASS